LWPTRDKLYIFDSHSAQPRKVVDLAARGAAGGNLLVADGRLLIATESELIAIGTHGGEMARKANPEGVTVNSQGRQPLVSRPFTSEEPRRGGRGTKAQLVSPFQGSPARLHPSRG
jgi:hypothetical protein